MQRGADRQGVEQGHRLFRGRGQQIGAAEQSAAELWVLERTPAPASPAGPDWMRMLAPILHRGLSPDTTWTLTAFLIPLVTLWLTRRLLFGR